jgi:hypothetical protein
MFYLNKFTFQPFVIASVLLLPFSVATANANEVSPNANPQNISNVSKSLQEIEKDALTNISELETPKTAQNATSVSQLTDVKPTDWAFTALQSLVERYGCIAGYPDNTFRGKQATTRYEFAAGLNACMDRINEIISNGLSDKVSKEDVATLQKLQEDFAAELATLRGRVDVLDTKVSKLEAQQFSPTTKLNATVIFALADTFGGVGAAPQATVDRTNTIFSYRARLNLDTSFTGKDRLRVRLQSANVANFTGTATTNTNSRMARLAFDTDTGNTFQIDKLIYRFPVGDSMRVFIGARALDADDIADTLNPYFESSDSGALSRFGRYDPLLFRTPQGTGFGLTYKINPQFTVAASYLTDEGTTANATGIGGLFGGAYSATLQLVYAPTKDLKFGVAYAHALDTNPPDANISGNTGSDFGRRPFNNNATSSDRYGAQFTWQASKNFNLAGWIGFANAQQLQGGANTASLFNWSINAAFPDLFAEGNRGGIIFGQLPKVTSNTIATRVDPDTSYILELQYGFRINKNIMITPGAFVVFNPNHNSLNPSILVTTIKTVFTF